MGINSQSDIAANLQIGPTDQGMVRIYLQGEGIDLPLDFDPEEAARDMGKTNGKPKKPRR